MYQGGHTIAGYSPETATTGDRYKWMDISRGVGVLLIVIMHAGTIYKGMFSINPPAWIDTLELASAPYRIPLLIFLSGILLSRSLAKGLPRFVNGKLNNLLWPFLIWTFVTVLAGNGPQGLLRIDPWLGGTTLWYIFFIGCYYAVALLLARVPFLIIAVFGIGIAMIAPTETRFGSRLFLLMSYFFVGAHVGRNLNEFTAVIRSRWILSLLPIVIGVSIYFSTQPVEMKYSPFIAPLILSAVICMCGILNRLPDGHIMNALLFVGRNSLIYYVVHIPIYFFVFNLYRSAGMTAAYFCIGTTMVLGICVPTMLALLKDRSQTIGYLFEGPGLRIEKLVPHLVVRLDKLLLPQYGAHQTSMGPTMKK